MIRWRLLLTTTLLLVAMFTVSARAHDKSVHQAMTDYAYEVMLASGQFSTGSLSKESKSVQTELRRRADTSPELNSFYADMAKAISKLRTLKSGLEEEGKPCLGGDVPNWKLESGTTLPETAMGKMIFPVASNYNRDSLSCGIILDWQPSGALATVNTVNSTHRDHTGVTLGYWAAAPDFELNDWRMRSTTLETLQIPVVSAGVGAGASTLVSAACVIICGFMPVLCPACPAIAVVAGEVVIDSIMDLNAYDMEHPDFVGLGHHVDVKPMPADANWFDDKRGKYGPGAGPNGTPDTLETMTFLLFDLLGWHVNYDRSEGPKNYQIILEPSDVPDLHANSVARTAFDWEAETAVYLQFTPVDNLGMFGWREFKKNTASGARGLGWALHALGDASVPMHTVGATGYGHRPYEESIVMKYHELVGSYDMGLSLATIGIVVVRAFEWRKVILDWRNVNGMGNEVPVRDLVTALAEKTRQKAIATPGVWKPDESLAFFFGFENEAKEAYDSPTMNTFQRDTVLEGIALKVAFLTSVAEMIE